MSKIIALAIVIMCIIGFMPITVAEDTQVDDNPEDFAFEKSRSSYSKSSYSKNSYSKTYRTPAPKKLISKPATPPGTHVVTREVYRDNGMGIMEIMILHEILDDDTGEVVNNYYGDGNGGYYVDDPNQNMNETPGFTIIGAVLCIGSVILLRRRGGP